MMQDSRAPDATRIADDTPVILKRVYLNRNTNEEEVILRLRQQPLASDARNHCVPVYEILAVPGEDQLRIIVMPLLRQYSDPPWDTTGEVVSCVQQIFEVRRFFILYSLSDVTQGLHFMHINRIAHRYDCFLALAMLLTSSSETARRTTSC
jgi:hypothetical protein